MMKMKKLLACLMATLGMMPACSQHTFPSVDVDEFAAMLDDPEVVVLDVRTAEEFAAGHIENALNIDQSQDNFLEEVERQIPFAAKVAIYCRSGRRSASAAGILEDNGYNPVNLKGGILAWQEANKPVTTETQEIDIFKSRSGKLIKVYTLMHGSVRVDYEGASIYVDPVTRLGDRTIDYSKMPTADLILITHEHPDHFDRAAIQTLTEERKTFIVTNARCGEMLGGKCHVMANRDELSANFEVKAVPAYNVTEGHTQFHPKGRDNGYIVNLDGTNVYFAGDTEPYADMAFECTAIDIAFLPCNQPYTMTPDQLVEAAQAIRPKVIFPYHYGDTDVSGLPARLADQKIDVRIRHFE